MLTHAINANSSSEISRSEHNDFWYSPITSNGGGMPMNSDSAMRISTVYACIKILSETLGSVPLNLYKQLTRGKEKDITNPRYRLMHDAPNDWQTSIEFLEMLQSHAALRGNGYAEIISGVRNPIEQLIPLNPDRVRVELLLRQKTFRYVYSDPVGDVRVIPKENMMHIRGLTLDGYTGLSPIDYERETFMLSMKATRYQNNVMTNDGQSPIALQYPGRFKDQEHRKSFANQWSEATTGKNRGKTPVLEDGMTVQKLGLTNREIQYIESRKFTREEIAGIFRIPLVLLQAGDKAETYASAEQFFLSFVKFTMVPWFRRWEQAMNRDLLFDNHELFFKFITEGLLRGDSAARSSFYNIMTSIGAMTRNEVREHENMNPREGLDEPLQQMNMTTPNQAAAKVVRKEQISVEDAYESSDSREDFNQWAIKYYTNFRKYMREHVQITLQNSNKYIEESVITIKNMDNVVLTSEWVSSRTKRLLELSEG